MIRELDNTIQAYAWGSRHALAELRGAPTPSPGPEAELWMGAHPLAPSRLAPGGESLLDVITAAPARQLGSPLAAAYDGKLPFLLKVLAAGSPLSLQAHPSLEQARAGFAADDAAGIPLAAPHRNYKDENHKPELLCALSEFWALCGFRQVPATLELLELLAVPGLADRREALAAAPDAHGLKQLFSSLMQAPEGERTALALATADACRAQRGRSSRFAAELDWGVRIAELDPGDVGLVSALLLNLLRLEPGEAIYLPAGNLHAYLGGTGVEIMASSDNVLRGGLTPKHVDVDELLRVLDFQPLDAAPLAAVARGREHVYVTPTREFELSYFDLTAEPLTSVVSGPEIWLVISGQAQLAAPGAAPVTLVSGRSAFVSADTGQLCISGSGRVFRAKALL